LTVFPYTLPTKKLWTSIRQGRDQEFRQTCNEHSGQWSKIITLSGYSNSQEFQEVRADERVNKLKVNQWKPLHLMIYYER